jgi:hypothetical protein
LRNRNIKKLGAKLILKDSALIVEKDLEEYGLIRLD